VVIVRPWLYEAAWARGPWQLGNLPVWL